MLTPAIRAIVALPLALLVSRVLADHEHPPVAADDLALLAHRLDRRSYLHGPFRLMILIDAQSILGLPAGVTLTGIDFRPKTGDLYGVGSDSVVYRINPYTGIAIAEAPAFTPVLRGTKFGVDFNPTVDKIRVVSDQRQNLRLNVDEGTVLSADADLNPGMPNIVGAAYTNSSFSFTPPTATTLYVVDSVTDQEFVQNPPNNGTLTNQQQLGVDVGADAGFDIAGADNTGYLTTRSRLYRVDPATGRTRLVGRIGNGRRTITGLAAW